MKIVIEKAPASIEEKVLNLSTEALNAELRLNTAAEFNANNTLVRIAAIKLYKSPDAPMDLRDRHVRREYTRISDDSSLKAIATNIIEFNAKSTCPIAQLFLNNVKTRISFRESNRTSNAVYAEAS